MKRLLTITIALVALTACSPLAPVAHLDRAEADVECPTAESCAPPTTEPASRSIDPTSAETRACLVDHSIEECADPDPIPPGPTTPPAANSAEGGTVDPGVPGIPYNGE